MKKKKILYSLASDCNFAVGQLHHKVFGLVL